MRVVWTIPGLVDLENTIGFIAVDNPSAAKELAARVRAAARGLQRFPNRGRMVPEYQDPTMRELIIGPLRVLYSTRDAECLTILAVVRGEQSLLGETD